MHLPKPVRVLDGLTRMSYSQLFLIWTGLTIALAFIYAALTYVAGHGPAGITEQEFGGRFFSALYFSIITATSTGYGDIVPLGASRVFASMQSISSLFVFAMIVTKLVSHRQEIALREVHKLSFEDIFHNIREDLYVVRNDLDRLIETIKEDRALEDDDWLTLEICYQQSCSVLQEIPDFYDGVNNLYMIDLRREELLHEAVHRTLHRFNLLLDTMSDHNVDWVSHESTVTELRELIDVTDAMTKLWRTKSPYSKTEPFEMILHLNDSVRSRLEAALPMQSDKA